MSKLMSPTFITCVHYSPTPGWVTCKATCTAWRATAPAFSKKFPSTMPSAPRIFPSACAWEACSFIVGMIRGADRAQALLKLLVRDVFGPQIAPANPMTPNPSDEPLVVIDKDRASVIPGTRFQVARPHDDHRAVRDRAFPMGAPPGDQGMIQVFRPLGPSLGLFVELVNALP